MPSGRRLLENGLRGAIFAPMIPWKVSARNPEKPSSPYRFPLRGAVGLALIAGAWSTSWLQVSPFGQNSFFPLWLGYILTMDALNLWRRGTSPLSRSPGVFLSMFLISAPMWWVFEGINYFTQNWHYLGVEDYSTLRYFVIASWHFSTVIPAVFETAELVGSLKFVDRFGARRPMPVSSWVLIGTTVLGLISLFALVTWPNYAFPATWISIFLLLDPINHLLGRPSVIATLRLGDWRLVIAMGTAALICGWFWEMWNYLAFPKWHYTVPFVQYAQVFEMPLLGYAGYLPFGLEVHAFYYFLYGLVRWVLTGITHIKWAENVQKVEEGPG